MLTLKGVHGTTKINAESIQKHGFKFGLKESIWGSGVYFFSEADVNKSKEYACLWVKSRGYHAEYSNLYSPVCLLADIDCSDNHYIDFQDVENYLTEQRSKIKTKYKDKDERNKHYRQLFERVLDLIVKERKFSKDNIVIRVQIPFPKGSKKNNGYCLVVTNTNYILRPYKEEKCI